MDSAPACSVFKGWPWNQRVIECSVVHSATFTEKNILARHYNLMQRF